MRAGREGVLAVQVVCGKAIGELQLSKPVARAPGKRGQLPNQSNVAWVLGCNSVGLGEAASTRLLSALSVPPVTSNTWARAEKRSVAPVAAAARASCQEKPDMTDNGRSSARASLLRSSAASSRPRTDDNRYGVPDE